MAKVALAVLVLALCGSVALAADMTLTGVVTVTKDEAGKVTAVKLTVKDGDKEVVYTVNPVCCDNCKKVADMAGKTVKVTGTVTEKEGVKNLCCAKGCEEVK